MADVEPSAMVSDELLTLMHHHLDVPATLTSPALDVLAANDLAVLLYSGFARFDNLMRMIFLDPVAHEFYADWDRAAYGVVANFRAGSQAHLGDPRMTAVVGELTLASPVFADIWARHEVRRRSREQKVLHHPHVGELRLDYQAFGVTGAEGQQLYVYSAAPGTPSADALLLLRHAPQHPHDNESEGNQ